MSHRRPVEVDPAYILQNISGSNEQHTDADGVPLMLQIGSERSIGAPIVRLAIHGPINLRGRSQDLAYKITVG
jgi:hypothetical protein